MDTLEIFGKEYTNVTGIKATDDNDTEQTYIRPQGTKSITANGNGIDVASYASVDVAVQGGGNDFVIVMSEDGQGNPVLDKTFSEISTAYYAGKNIVVQSELYYPTYAQYLDDDDCLLVEVCIPDYEWNTYNVKGYNFYSNNMIPEDYGTFYLSDGTTAVPSDVANGKTFINADGWQTGTYSGGSAKNVQAYTGYATRTANSYGATSVTLTVAKTGTYNVSWCAWKSSSQGTMGTNLYVNSTAGTNQQTFTNTYGQCITLSNQSYNKDDVLTIYATSGSTTRSIMVANLVITEV